MMLQQQKQLSDVPLVPGPDDSVTKLEFCPTADYLAVGSWDSQCRVYQIDPTSGTSTPKTAVQHEGPVLGVAWSKDGSRLLTCSSDTTVKLTDLASGAPAQVVAKHDAAISCVRWLDMPSGGGQGVCVTGGWDRVIKYWDMRQQNPIAQLDTKERVYAMDSQANLLVYGTADRQISCVDLANPGAIKHTKESPLKMQTRVITCFPTANGYAVGSVEGRVAMQMVDDKDNKDNFSFKCHRQESVPATRSNPGETMVYSVNAISFNKMYGTFSTAGSDGTLSFWDKDQRTRLKTYSTKELRNGENNNLPTPIVSTSFNHNSTLFAYAYSYDWSKGYQGNTPAMQTKVLLHQVQPDEIKPKQKDGVKR